MKLSSFTKKPMGVLVNQFRTHCPRVRIINTYGPTEASISTIYHEVPDPCTDPIPFGSPLKNVKAVILDDQLNLVPVGCRENYI